MLKSSVLTQPSRIFLPISLVSVVLAVAYGAFTGDWLGIILYLLVFLVAGFAGVVVASFRVNEEPAWVPADAPPPEVHELVPVPLPAGGWWSVTAAAAIGLMVLGFVAGPLAAYFGVGMALATVAGWLARVSTDTTGRPIDLMPIGLPVLGLVTTGALIFFMSRILLAVPEQASTAIALGVAVLILGLATLLALRPSISSRTMVAVLAVSSVLMVVGGLVAAAAGEREIEHHGGEHGEAVSITVEDILFDRTELTLPAGEDATIVLHNNDEGIPHNLSIYQGQDATAPPLLQGDIITGPGEITYHVTIPEAGEYYFQCDVHPSANGTVHAE